MSENIESIRRQVLSHSQVKKLLEALDPNDLLGRTILEMLYSTGIRAKELVSLNLGDIDFLGEVIEVGESKRIVPISTSALKAITSYREVIQKEHKKGQTLLVNSDDEPFSPDRIETKFQVYLSSARMDLSLTSECLRHTFAVHMWKAGMEPESIKELMGDVSIDHIQIYEELAKE